MNVAWRAVLFVLAVSVVGLLPACSTKPLAPPALPPPAAPSAQEPAPPGALSYGMVTSQVKKGLTTQQELVELFGGPNIASTDSTGTEVWVYDRTSSRTDTTYQHSAAAAAQSEVSRLGVFFGLGVTGKDTASAATAGQTGGQARTVHSVQSITVIIKFNAEKTVKDYSVRSAGF